MGIRRYNPTTPGRRGASVSDFAELTPGARPEKSLLIRKKKKGGRNNQGVITARHRGGGHKQQYRVIDFHRDKDGVPAKVAFDPVRSEPQRPHRPVALRRRREALHPRPRGLEGRRRDHERPRCAAERSAIACRCATFRSAWRFTISRCSPAAAGDCAARPASQRHAGRPRGRLGPDHASQRRNSPHPVDLPGHDRPDRQFRPHEHRHRQGRPQSLEGHSAARSRHGDEPDRPSARRRRRPHQGRPPSGQPDGQVRQGRPHPQAPQAVELGHRSPPPVAPLRTDQDSIKHARHDITRHDFVGSYEITETP